MDADTELTVAQAALKEACRRYALLKKVIQSMHALGLLGPPKVDLFDGES